MGFDLDLAGIIKIVGWIGILIAVGMKFKRSPAPTATKLRTAAIEAIQFVEATPFLHGEVVKGEQKLRAAAENWLGNVGKTKAGKLLKIHAGIDEEDVVDSAMTFIQGFVDESLGRNRPHS